MISIIEHQKLLEQIADKLLKKMEIYAIGGNAMMLYGIKNLTIDIDLVFTNKKDREIFKAAAISLGYKEMSSRIIYGGKNNIPEMINLGDARIDMFLLDIINFTFSKSMQGRAKDIHQFGSNLFIKTADIHDIIIMKCATERLKDEEDIVKLINSGKTDWKILIEEAKEQVKLGNELAFLGLGSILEKVKNKDKVNIPQEVLDNLWDLLKKQAESRKKAGK